MDTLKQDISVAARSLFRNPGMAIAAVICLGLGIGATTTVFSAMKAIVLNPVPVRDGDRVVRVSELPPNPPDGIDGSAIGTALEWRREAQSIDALAAFRWTAVNLAGTIEPERLTGTLVMPAFFSILGQSPLHGRALVEADGEAGAPPVLVLSEPLWRRRFGGDARVIGSTVQVDGVAHEIVGVMPNSFVFPPGAELWLPMQIPANAEQQRGPNAYAVIARLKTGFSVEQAHAEINAIQRDIVARYPNERANWTAIVEPVQRFYGAFARPYLVVAFAAVLFVLLIGCANVANLLLARATARERELAVRSALGASRLRLIRQLLTESVVLALTGGIAGVLVALWGVRLFRNAIPPELVRFNPGWTTIRVDGETLVFALGLALGTSLIFGVLPALQAARPGIQGTLRDGARGMVGGVRNRTRNALVVAEIALALMLVVGTGIMLSSFRTLVNADPGFRQSGVLAFAVALPAERYAEAAERIEFYRRFEEGVNALPEVRAAGLTSILPMDYADSGTRVTDQARADAKEEEQPIVRIRYVSSGYFSTLNVPLIRGRNFDSRDHADAPRVAIISNQLARQLWPHDDPIGKRIRLLGGDHWHEVVGVAADVRHNPNSGFEPTQPTVHLALSQVAPRTMSMVVHTRGEPATATPAIRGMIAEIDPAMAIGDVQTLERLIHNALAPQRVSAGMIAIFGLVALILASVGVFGVMSYTVAKRASEIGVRIALGAGSRDVVRLVLGQGARLTLAGGLIGLGGAWFMARSMGALMKDANRMDPLAFATGVLVLTGVALLACYIPARRAAATDPTGLLRQE